MAVKNQVGQRRSAATADDLFAMYENMTGSFQELTFKQLIVDPTASRAKAAGNPPLNPNSHHNPISSLPLSPSNKLDCSLAFTVAVSTTSPVPAEQRQRRSPQVDISSRMRGTPIRLADVLKGSSIDPNYVTQSIIGSTIKCVNSASPKYTLTPPNESNANYRDRASPIRSPVLRRKSSRAAKSVDTQDYSEKYRYQHPSATPPRTSKNLVDKPKQVVIRHNSPIMYTTANSSPLQAPSSNKHCSGCKKYILFFKVKCSVCSKNFCSNCSKKCKGEGKKCKRCWARQKSKEASSQDTKASFPSAMYCNRERQDIPRSTKVQRNQSTTRHG